VYGIRKLRELILELAVRGKLVPQDANDEPASELLKRIQAEKAKLIAESKIKKDKPLPTITEEEKPFELPQGWEWARLGFIGNTQTGATPSKANPESFGSDIPFIKPGDIYPNYVEYSNEGLSFYGAEQSGRIAHSGSILMVCIGTIGKCNFIEKDCSFNQQINSVTPYLFDSHYLLSVCRSVYFYTEAWSRSSSTTIAILNKGNWEEICIPIPPLAEQHRIVAKVDELMALCDQLENQHNNAAVAHEQLVSQLLATLTLSQNAADFSANWQRIAAHFDTLFTTEASIDALKQTLLQLAVMGKLVPQDPNDEPASELLKRIQAEKAKLIGEGKIKKDKPIDLISDEEKPFKLPKGWQWVKCQDICLKITDGEHATPRRSNSGNYLLSARNVTNEGIILDDVDYVPLDEFQRIRSRCDPNIGDILISCSGSVGRVAAVDKDNTYSMVRSAAMIRPNNNWLCIEYLVLLFRSIYLQYQMKKRSKQSAQANLFLGAISNLVLIIPPLAEQHRIVTKIDELMAICDQLKSHVNDASQLQRKLADVMIEQAVA
jgi:type I restriction enzyme S subunit